MNEILGFSVPHSELAEQYVISHMLFRKESVIAARSALTKDSFYNNLHSELFESICSVADKGVYCDVNALCQHIAHQSMEYSELNNYVLELTKQAEPYGNIDRLLRVIKEHEKLRALINVGIDLQQTSRFDPSVSVSEITENALSKISIIDSEGRYDKEIMHIGDAFSNFTQDLNAKLTGTSSSIIPTGIAAIDKKIGGIADTDLVIVSGRPGMGKTALAMNIVENVSIQGDMPTIVFSLEMQNAKLISRMVSSLGGIDGHRLKEGTLNQVEMSKLTSTLALIDDKKLFICQNRRITPRYIEQTIKDMKAEHGKLGPVVVDYVQLMSANEPQQNVALELASISRDLKVITEEQETPIILLSQLNRDVEYRIQKNINEKPNASDLRGGGGLEENADTIIITHRPEVYREGEPKLQGYAELVFAKVREGELGVEPLRWTGKNVRFDDGDKNLFKKAQEYLSDQSYNPSLN